MHFLTFSRFFSSSTLSSVGKLHKILIWSLTCFHKSIITAGGITQIKTQLFAHNMDGGEDLFREKKISKKVLKKIRAESKQSKEMANMGHSTECCRC